MSYALGFFLGGVAFSFVASTLYLLKDCIWAPKSPYELWTAENMQDNIVRSTGRRNLVKSRFYTLYRRRPDATQAVAAYERCPSASPSRKASRTAAFIRPLRSAGLFDR